MKRIKNIRIKFFNGFKLNKNKSCFKMKFEMKRNENSNGKKSNNDNIESPINLLKSPISKINDETKMKTKSKSKKANKDKIQNTASGFAQEIDFSKRDVEIQHFLTGNLNKILYTRNKSKKSSKLINEDIQILSIKDIINVKSKLSKLSNDESISIRENSLDYINLNGRSKNSNLGPFNDVRDQNDKHIENDNLKSLNKNSEIKCSNNGSENFSQINKFVNTSKEDARNKSYDGINIRRISKFFIDNDVNSPIIKSTNNNGFNKNLKRVSTDNKLDEKISEKIFFNNFSNLKNEEMKDNKENIRYDLKRLQIFSEEHSKESLEENYMDLGLKDKKENLMFDSPNKIIRIKGNKLINNLNKLESGINSLSPKKGNINRKYSQNLEIFKKKSENNIMYENKFNISPPFTRNENKFHSNKLNKNFLHSKTLAVKNHVKFHHSNEHQISFKKSERALNQTSSIKMILENNGNYNSRKKNSLKEISNLIQISNIKAPIKSSKSIINTANFNQYINPHKESPSLLNIDNNKSDESDNEKEKHRKLIHRNKVIDSHSDSEDRVIQNDQYTAEGFVFDLNSAFISYWEFLITLITLYTLTYSPYKMAFPEVTNIPIEIMECFMDLIFIVDIAFQFFIPFYNEEEDLIKSKYLIAVNYLKSWLLIDLIASIPGSIITYFLVGLEPPDDYSAMNKINSSSLGNINKFTRMAKIYRVLKITKLSKVLKMSGDNTNKKRGKKLIVKEDMKMSSSLKRIFNFLFVFVFASHMISCIWIFIGTSDHPNWIIKAKLSESSNFAIYISSLYFHWTTIFTIGYGDILSANSNERLYNTLIMFIGVLIYSFAVSALGTILSTEDKSMERFLKNIDTLYDLRVRYNIPIQFYDKVEKFLRYDFQNNKMEKFTFISDLPMRIKNELLLNMYRDVIKNFKFFKEKSIDFSTKVVYMMKPLRLSKNEYLLLEGEFVEEIVFVRRGFLTINLGFKYNELKIMEIRPNEHFGDILVLLNLPSPVGIKVASKFADLIIIRKEDIIELSNLFPECIQKIFWISSYNYYAMMSLVEKKKLKFNIEEEKTLKKQMLYDEYINCIKQKKRANSVFVTNYNPNAIQDQNNFEKIYYNNKNSHNPMLINNNNYKRYSLPFNNILNAKSFSEKNFKVNNLFDNNAANKLNKKFTFQISNKSFNNFDKENKIDNKDKKISLFFKQNNQNNLNLQINNYNNFGSEENFKLTKINSKRPDDKTNKISYIKNNSKENFDLGNFSNDKKDIVESHFIGDNINNLIEMQNFGKNTENSFIECKSISSNSKTNMLKKPSFLNLLKIDSSNNSINFKKKLNSNDQICLKDDKNNQKQSFKVKSIHKKNEIFLNDKSKTNNNIGDIADFTKEQKNDSFNFIKKPSNELENNEIDFSYNKFNQNDHSSLIGIKNCNYSVSRKNSELLTFKDNSNLGNNELGKLNKNLYNNKNHANNDLVKNASDKYIYKSSSNKRSNENQNIRITNIANNNNNNNYDSISKLINKDYNRVDNNQYITNEAFNDLNKKNLTNKTNNIPQSICNSNISLDSNSSGSNKNHNIFNKNTDLITLTTKNSNIFINRKPKSDAELNNNNNQNSNNIINTSNNLIEKLNKSNEENLKAKNKVNENKNSTNNVRKLNSNTNNIIYIDNLNINNNCNHIYESGAKKCGDAYCISNESEGKNNFFKTEKKNKSLNNLYTLKTKLKYKEDEGIEKSAKDDDDKIYNKNYGEKNDLLIKPSIINIKNKNKNNNESENKIKKCSSKENEKNNIKNNSIISSKYISSSDSLAGKEREETKMQILNKLTKRNSSKNNFSLKQNKNDSIDSDYKEIKYKKGISKTISFPSEESKAPINELKTGLLEEKNLEALKSILNYREKEFQIKERLSLKTDVLKTKELQNNKKTYKLNEIEEEEFFSNFNSGKRIKQINSRLTDKNKENDNDNYECYTDLKQANFNSDWHNTKKLNKDQREKNSNGKDKQGKKSESFKISKLDDFTKQNTDKNDFFKNKYDSNNIDLESSNKSIKIEEKLELINSNKNKSDYLSKVKNENLELRRFLTLGIKEEYKLEADKINKIVVKILENQNRQDFFTLDKNKQTIKFKDFFIFNTNMINKVKKINKAKRKMDKMKIPFVEI